MENQVVGKRRAGKNLAFATAGVLAFMFAGAMIAANARPAQSQPASTAAVPTAAQKYKNIQVLKDIPADQLIPTMQFISSALGVECDFLPRRQCRQAGVRQRRQEGKEDRARDDADDVRHQQEQLPGRARGHLQHLSSRIAASAGDSGDHGRRPKPEAMEAMHDDMDMDPAKLPSGAPVLAKYIQALGGQAAVDKVSDRVEKGQALMPEGPAIPIDIYSKAPDQRVSAMHTRKGDSVTAYNGQAGWITFPGRPLREMSASDQQAAKLDAEAFYPEQFEHEFTELKLQEHPEKVGDRETNVVLGLSKGQPPVKLYFDKESGLLLRMVHYTDTPLGLNPTQVDYSDYRDAGGVKTPYRWTIARPSGSFTIQVDHVEQNVPIDGAKFVKPAAK